MWLIDANPIFDKVEANYRMSEGVQHVCEREFLNLICDAQTVDAVPVVHGEWKIGIDANGDPVTYCSNCKMPNYVQTNYCPDCGAKMNMKKGKQE